MGILEKMFIWLFGTSWKTTLAGLTPFLMALAWQLWNHFDGDPSTVFDMGIILASLSGLAVGRAARSTGTSDEESGIHPSRTGKHAYMMAIAKKQGVEPSQINMAHMENPDNPVV